MATVEKRRADALIQANRNICQLEHYRLAYRFNVQAACRTQEQ
jgi:hypothetical protein